MSSSAEGAADVEAKSSTSPSQYTRNKSPTPEQSSSAVAQDAQAAVKDVITPPATSPQEPAEGDSVAPPLPAEEEPPLPSEESPLPAEAPPAQVPEDDGWAPVWDGAAGAYYFYNRFTHATQWENPRVPEATVVPPALAPGVTAAPPMPAELAPGAGLTGGYDPAIHGDYDETAWYAQVAVPVAQAGPANPAAAYEQTGHFNRFTGRWQAAELTPDNFNDEAKSKRQMNAFFDVDLAANSHDGKSLKAERSGKKLSKSEVKQFKQKRKAKKEEKRRAWLLD